MTGYKNFPESDGILRDFCWIARPHRIIIGQSLEIPGIRIISIFLSRHIFLQNLFHDKKFQYHIQAGQEQKHHRVSAIPFG